MRKRVFKNFQYRECGAFAEYLGKQSRRGWHFREWRMGLVFEKGEPEEITYAVEVFPKGSEMDTRPGDEAQEYGDYCEAAGWKLLDGKRRFCIFRRETEDAVSIVTPEERLHNVWKASVGSWLWMTVVPLFLTLQYWFQIYRFSGEWLLSNLMVLVVFGITVLALLYILRGIGLFIWKVKAKRRLREGNPVDYGRCGSWDNVFRVLFLGGFFFLAYREQDPMILKVGAVTLIVCILLAVCLEMWRPSRADNWAAQLGLGFALVFVTIVMVVAVIMQPGKQERKSADFGEMPLAQEVFNGKQGKVSAESGEIRKSILATESIYSVEYMTEQQEAGEPEETETFSYQIYESRYRWVLDIFWKNEKRRIYRQGDSEGTQNCAKEWGAELALCEEKVIGIYVVKYPDKVVVLYTTPALTKEKVRIIGEKLAGEEN